MSAFKPFISSDIIVSPFEVTKDFSFFSSAIFQNNGIDRFIGKNINPDIFISGSNPTGYINTVDQDLLYNSIKGLYYSNFLDNPNGSQASLPLFNIDGTITGSVNTTNFYNYPQTTLTQSRYFPTASNSEIFVLSIPSNLYGEYIQPGSFLLNINSDQIILTDNGEGNIISGSVMVGNIIYEHGIVIITNDVSMSLLYSSSNPLCEFTSTITLYESQYRCNIRENEFNFSQNPTLISGSSNSGILLNFATSSYFNPYITTVGLYNNNKELLAVAKLSTPLPTSPTTDTNIIINLDR
jgi:hypothetical protein